MSSEAQRNVIRFFEERPTMRQFDTPRRLMILLAGEVDEAMKEIWEDGKDPTPEQLGKFKSELADVAIYLITLAHSLGIDLEEAVQNKIDLNQHRFPAHLFKDGDFQTIYEQRKRRLGER